jgi:hypothetical protein
MTDVLVARGTWEINFPNVFMAGSAVNKLIMLIVQIWKEVRLRRNRCCGIMLRSKHVTHSSDSYKNMSDLTNRFQSNNQEIARIGIRHHGISARGVCQGDSAHRFVPKWQAKVRGCGIQQSRIHLSP